MHHVSQNSFKNNPADARELGIVKTGEWDLMDKCRMLERKCKEHSSLLRIKLLTERRFINSGRRIYREQSQSQELEII